MSHWQIILSLLIPVFVWCSSWITTTYFIEEFNADDFKAVSHLIKNWKYCYFSFQWLIQRFMLMASDQNLWILSRGTYDKHTWHTLNIPMDTIQKPRFKVEKSNPKAEYSDHSSWMIILAFCNIEMLGEIPLFMYYQTTLYLAMLLTVAST